MKFADAFYAFIYLSVQQTVVESLLSVRARAGRTDLYLVREVSFTPSRAIMWGFWLNKWRRKYCLLSCFPLDSTAESTHSFSVH